VIFCVRRLTEDGTPVPKHVDVILTMNSVTRFVFYCTLFSAFLGQYTERKKTHGMPNKKRVFHVGFLLCWKRPDERAFVERFF
jgi:hypothetical protein